ncbi:MAG: AAA family ATPase [Gemmatimonadota bacterium]
MTDNTPISSAVISTDPKFRAVFHANGDGETQPVEVAFEIIVPFAEVSHGHLEELRVVQPSIVFIDLEDDPILGCKLAQFLVETNPGLRLVAAGTDGSPEFLMTVMQAGISEYLPKPVTEDTLEAAIGRVSRKLGAKVTQGAGPARREPGKLLAFFGTKGGSGSTTVATNLAIQVHRMTGKRTVLVDLDLELGEIALYLGVEPRFNFVDLAKNFHRMDAGLLASFIECHDSGVHLLSAPYHPERAESVTADHAKQIIQFLKQHYEYVFVDVSNSFSTRTLAAFEKADEVYLIATADLPSLRNIQRCQHLIGRLSNTGELRLVVNRYHPDCDITLEDVEKSIGMEIYWALPNDYQSVIYAINTGQPVILDDASPYTHELEALAAKMTGLPSASSHRKGWFSRKVVDPLKSFLGSEADEEEALMLPPAVVGGERA